MNATNIRIGYMPGPWPLQGEAIDYLRSLVDLGDRVGFDSLWVPDSTTINSRNPDPMVILSLVSVLSSSLKFGTSVIQIPIRNPIILAKEMATLDNLSRGRLLPAIGLGPEDPKKYQAFGIDRQYRGPITDESVMIMKRLWTEDTVTFRGKFYSFENMTLYPKPFQKPCLPIWIGGNSIAAQRRVGRIGDGWLPSSVTPKEIAKGINNIYTTADIHHRTVDDGHIGVVIGYNIAKNETTAIGDAKDHITKVRNDVRLTEYTALGSPEQVLSMLNQYIDVGVTKFVVRPICRPENVLDQLRTFAEELLPQFHVTT